MNKHLAPIRVGTREENEVSNGSIRSRCRIKGAGENTVFGFYAKHLVFYTHYEGPIDRDQFLLTLLSPFVALSVMPLLFCSLIGEAPALLRFTSVWNAMGCSADILGFFLILFGVPQNAGIRNQGSKTWWRPVTCSPHE